MRSRILGELLATITSPVFSEIVVVFTEEDAHWPPQGITDVLREMYGIQKFRVVFCLETLEALRTSNLRALTLATQREVASGSFDFLPCPPLICSRMVTKREHFMAHIRNLP